MRVRVKIGISPRDGQYRISPQEMRKEIFDCQRDSMLVVNSIHRAQQSGFGGEDTMTVIAYFAMVQLQEVFEQLQRMHALSTRIPPIFRGEDEGIPESHGPEEGTAQGDVGRTEDKNTDSGKED